MCVLRTSRIQSQHLVSCFLAGICHHACVAFSSPFESSLQELRIFSLFIFIYIANIASLTMVFHIGQTLVVSDAAAKCNFNLKVPFMKRVRERLSVLSIL